MKEKMWYNDKHIRLRLEHLWFTLGKSLHAPNLNFLSSKRAKLSQEEGFPGSSVVKNLSAMQETGIRSLGWENPLEKGMATHSSILAWRIPWTEQATVHRVSKQLDMTEATENTHTEASKNPPWLWSSWVLKRWPCSLRWGSASIQSPPSALIWFAYWAFTSPADRDPLLARKEEEREEGKSERRQAGDPWSSCRATGWDLLLTTGLSSEAVGRARWEGIRHWTLNTDFC